jgi:hypothetical protein
MKLLWLVVLLAAGFAAQTQAAVIGTFQVGHWTGAAYADSNGDFSHCAAGMKFNSNVTLLFSLNKNFVWTIAFHNPAWAFESGQRVTLTLAIDKTPPMKREAEVFNPSGIVITLEDDADLFRRFKSAKRVKISGARESFEFEMNRMDELLTKLLACAKQNNGAPNTPVAQNPFITTKKAGSEIAAEATAFAANLLSEAKISGYLFMGPNDNPRLRGDARWVIPGGGTGSIQVFPDIDLDAQKTMSRQLIAEEARACDGKFGSGSLPDDGNGSSRAFIVCDIGETTFVLYYFFIPRVAGGAYVVATGFYGTPAGAARAKEEHENFRNAVFTAKVK